MWIGPERQGFHGRTCRETMAKVRWAGERSKAFHKSTGQHRDAADALRYAEHSRTALSEDAAGTVHLAE